MSISARDRFNQGFISYRLKDFNGTAFSGQYEDTLLSEFIACITSVLKEMKVGEVHEIWMHPECTFQNGENKMDLGLQGQLELFAASACDVKASNEPIQSVSLNEATSNKEELLNRYIELKKRAGYNYGADVKRALRFILDLDQAALAFREQTISSDLSLEESEQLFRAHLAIFSRQREEEKQVALQHFQKLTTKRIAKNRLYLELLEKDKGPKIRKKDVVEVKQLISNHLGDVLSQKKTAYNLKTTIEGYQAGLAGQTVGSKLKLYIHPEWEYKSFASPLSDTFLIADGDSFNQKLSIF